MQTALEALDRGVQKLFSELSLPRKTRLGDHPRHPLLKHPLCECLKLHPLPDEWTHLRRHPVLKKYVLSRWQAHLAQQRREMKAKKPPSLSSSAYARSRAVVVQSVHSLCVYLFQCGLLHTGEQELVQLLVLSTFRCGLGDVLLRKENEKTLPMRARMLLVQMVLRVVCKQQLRSAEIQKLMEDMCTSLQDEVLEAGAAVATPSTAAVAKRSARQTVWAGAAQSQTGPQLVTAGGGCDFCQSEERSLIVTRASPPWTELQGLVSALQDMLHGFESDGYKVEANKAMKTLASLRNVLVRPDVALRFRSREIDIHDRTIQRFASRPSDRSAPMHQDWRIRMSEYEHICRRTVLQEDFPTDVTATLWGKIHEKELQRCVRRKDISLHDVIVHCAKTDLFASVQSRHIKTTDLPGYRIVRQVLRTLQVDSFAMILVFKRVWSEVAAPVALGGLTIRSSASTGTVSAVCRSYLADLLSDSERQRFVNRAEDNLDGDPGNGGLLLELLHALYCIFSDSLYDQSERTYCAQWDRLFRSNELCELCPSGAGSKGLIWLNGLRLCCETIADVGSEVDAAFKMAYLKYAQEIIRTVVAENGATISSGGLLRQRLVQVEVDMEAVQQTVSSIAGSCSSVWLCELIAQILSSQLCSKRRAWSMEVEVQFRRGLKRLLFPALASHIEAAVATSSEEIATNKGDRFFDIVSQATEKMRIVHGSGAFAADVLRFCADWDIFDAQARDGKSARNWGRASFPRLKLLPELLYFYEHDQALAQEHADVLCFLGEVLQNETNCPPNLEESLFSLLSGIKSQLEDPQGLPNADARLLPISHSDNELAGFMYEVNAGGILQTRGAMERLRNDRPALDKLVQHLKRWVGLMELNDPRAAVGKESKLNLAVLCNRLTCWLPNEYLREVCLAVTPVNPNLSASLSSFANEDQDEDDLVGGVFMSSSGSSSVVRLELLFRSYLYSSVIPDLCELTDILINSIADCKSVDARDGLVELAQRISSSLLVEVAIETLRLIFSTECLLYMDAGLQAHHGIDDDLSDPPANRLANALHIVQSASSIFSSNDVTWSVSLFDGQAVQHWLMCFFDCIVHAELSRARVPVHELLSSLHLLMESSNGTHMTSHSYLLVALLCTASFPQSRILQASWSDWNASVEAIAQKILSVVSLPCTAKEDGVLERPSEDDCEVLFAQLEPLKVARAKVWEERVEVASESYLGTGHFLSTRLQTRTAANHSKKSEIAADPGYRIFVRFSSWLPSALLYSQSHVASLENVALHSHIWEQTFVDYVVYLYLPLEFENCVSKLLREWVSIWVRMNQQQASESANPLAILPFQQKLFRRLSLMQPKDEARVLAKPVWTLVFGCAHQVVEYVDDSPDGISSAIEVMNDTIVAFDLADLSMLRGMLDAENSLTEMLDEFDALCTHHGLSSLSNAEVLRFLQYPLELMAFCYISFDQESEVLRPQWILARVITALGSSFVSAGNTSGKGKQLGVEATAFWNAWIQRIHLRYAYLDQRRCQEFIRATTDIVSGEKPIPRTRERKTNA